jgi:hypothetical protein
MLSDWISTAFASELTIHPNRHGHMLFQRILNLIFDYYSTATSVLTILHPLSHDKGSTQSLDVSRTQKMSWDWRPVLTTYRRGHTWLTGVTLKCTSYLTVWRASFTLRVPDSSNLRLETSSSVFVVLFRSLYINAGIPDYPNTAKNFSCQYIAN